MNDGLILRLGLTYLAKRGVIKPSPRDELQIELEFKASPEERREALEMADELAYYVDGVM